MRWRRSWSISPSRPCSSPTSCSASSPAASGRPRGGRWWRKWAASICSAASVRRLGGNDSGGGVSGGEVQVVDLVKRFGPITAVHGINLHMPGGEFFSMLGPSGCGKTTTLRMIAGFEQPSEGKILLDGEDMTGTPPHRRHVNTVFQNYALFPHLNVQDNVAFGLRRQRVERNEVQRRVAEALDLVQLTGFEKRKPAQLSGGQQQRVALARALVLKPAVLLLDEPLGALDAKLRKTLQIELKALQQQVGITFIYVTHDQEEALTMSDRI